MYPSECFNPEKAVLLYSEKVGVPFSIEIVKFLRAGNIHINFKIKNRKGEIFYIYPNETYTGYNPVGVTLW